MHSNPQNKLDASLLHLHESRLANKRLKNLEEGLSRLNDTFDTIAGHFSVLAAAAQPKKVAVSAAASVPTPPLSASVSSPLVPSEKSRAVNEDDSDDFQTSTSAVRTKRHGRSCRFIPRKVRAGRDTGKTRASMQSDEDNY